MVHLAKRLEVWETKRLIPYERNARTHSSEQVTKIAASIAEFGFTNPILVDSKDGIIAGHARLTAAKTLGLAEVPVIVLDNLSEAQRRAYILADNKLAEMAGWDVDLLKEEIQWLDDSDQSDILESIGFSDAELSALLSNEDLIETPKQPVVITAQQHISQQPTNTATPEPANENTEPAEEVYSRKVEAPTYTPTGEKPAISELYDYAKTKELMASIERSSVPEDVKAFLRLAAERHTVFNHKNIAEYYAHSSTEVQRLMEDSALVIIDFNKAMENGFIELTKRIQEQYAENVNGSGDDDSEA